MKHLIRIVVATLVLSTISAANAQNGELSINGLASFEQLRKEYYIGAVYLGWPGHDPAAIANMPGKKRMELHITADRWPALRFSQMWNQLITINNPIAVINANATDIVAFTSIPKGDLVEGDSIAIELTGNGTTQISLNGMPALHTDSSALFTMLLNTWIGQRPPSSEFKRDILDLPKDKAGVELLARFNASHPTDTRKKAIATWGLKAEPEPAAASSTTTAVTAAATATPRPTSPATTPAPAAAAPIKKSEPVAAAAPKPEAEEKAKEASSPVAVAPQPNSEAKEKQKVLYGEYIGQIRKQVVRNIDYPKRAVKENIEGLVMIRVKVDRAGSLVSFEIVQSADDLLDAAAERAAQKAAPFAKPSEELEGNIFETQIPIVFKLTQ